MWFFKTNQEDQLTADKLFKHHLNKCRCCFSEMPEDVSIEENIIQERHSEAFQTLTNVELSCVPELSVLICNDCVFWLKAFAQFKAAASELQEKYQEHVRGNSNALATIKNKVNTPETLREIHDPEKFSCDLCNFSTDNKIDLINHFVLRHEMAKRKTGSSFDCHIEGCSKSFKFGHYLVKHINSVHSCSSKVSVQIV